MPQIEREISRNVEFITKDGKVYKKTIIYHFVGNAKITNLDDSKDDDPSVKEFRELALNIDDSKPKDGYIEKN